MTEVDTENLVPTSTDMFVGMLGNTDKLVSSNKRWNYADHKGEKDYDDDLDVDPHVFMNNAKKSSKGFGAESIFVKPRDHEDKRDDKRDDKHEDKRDDRHDDRHDDNGTRSGSKNRHRDNDTTSVADSDTVRDDTDTSHLSKKELILLKLDLIRKLGELKQCGVNLSQNYNLDSDLDMMQYEYKLHHDIRSKQNSVQWMSHMMIGIIKGTEILNDNYNPFDIKLDGLSNKIGSDMHNYYAVLGDIYEKYNQPGKQMAPEMRLLLMISGAALNMQINKVAPGVGSMSTSNVVKTEENLTDLRQKAESDTNADTNSNSYIKKQHDSAAQKAADLKMIQEKELELKRTNKMLDAKNGTSMRKFKERLVLSSEAPPSQDKRRGKQQDNNEDEDEDDDENEDDDDNEEDNPHNLSKAEIEHIRKMRYLEEQKHLELLRRNAHTDSEMFRNKKNELFRNNMIRNDTEEKRKRDLAKQNQQMDDILDSIDKMTVNKSKLQPKPQIKPKLQPKSQSKIQPKSQSKTKTVPESTRSSKRKSSDEVSSASTSSTASSVSINPRAKAIMKNTAEKAKIESQKKYSNFSDDLSSSSSSLKLKPQPKPQPKPKLLPKLVNTKPLKTQSQPQPTINTNTKSKPKLSVNDFKFDEKIEMLLDNNPSEFDDMSRDEISIGSRDKKSKGGDTGSGSGSKTFDPLDFGMISIGSKTKGKKLLLTAGKK